MKPSVPETQILSSCDVTVAFSSSSEESDSDEQYEIDSETGLVEKIRRTCGAARQSASLIDRNTGQPLISLRSIGNILKRHELQKSVRLQSAERDNQVYTVPINWDKSVQVGDDHSLIRESADKLAMMQKANKILQVIQSPASNLTDTTSLGPYLLSGDLLRHSADTQNATCLSSSDNQLVYPMSKSVLSYCEMDETEDSTFSGVQRNIITDTLKYVSTDSEQARCETKIAAEQSPVKPDWSIDKTRHDLVEVKKDKSSPLHGSIMTDSSITFDLIDLQNEVDFTPRACCEIKADQWWMNAKLANQNQSMQNKKVPFSFCQIPKLSLSGHANDDLDASETELPTESRLHLDQAGDKPQDDVIRRKSLETYPRKSLTEGLEAGPPTSQSVYCVQIAENQAPVKRQGEGDSESEVPTRSFMYTDRSSKNYLVGSTKGGSNF